MKKELIFIVLLILVLSCDNEHHQKNSFVRIYNIGSFLIKETYDSLQHLKIKQFFNKDTVPNGALITFYPNGKIYTWKWYFDDDKNPRCKIIYDSNGHFSKMEGYVIIDSQYIRQNIDLALALPPGLKFIVKVKSLDKGLLHQEMDCYPYLNGDTIGVDNDTIYNIATFRIEKYNKKLTYKACVYLDDSNIKQPNCLDSIELINFSK